MEKLRDLIDWDGFDEFAPNENVCRCGEVYVSHSKFYLAKKCIVTRRPCPKCGSDHDVRSSSSTEPEVFTIGGDE
jgi:hypothetical protein